MSDRFDPAPLRHLMQLAGAALAPELHRRLLDDLGAVVRRLRAGASDPAAVQAQCHVLMSLSGTVGAMALHAQAESLHHAAISGDRSSIDALLPATLTATLALMQGIETVAP